MPFAVFDLFLDTTCFKVNRIRLKAKDNVCLCEGSGKSYGLKEEVDSAKTFKELWSFCAN